MEKKEMLKITIEYIGELKLLIIKIIEILQSSEYKEGLKLIPEMTRGLEFVSIAVEDTKDIQVETISLIDMNKKLLDIVDALECGDNILVADLFEYELMPIIEEIEQKLKKI
ncbi:hypothetical protein FDB37_01735 [Clostridium botulinum]|nr:hypothetical protein [Clostridium botulinum]